MPRLSHNEFCERYKIVSMRGRCYGRTMLLNTATRMPLFQVSAELTRADVAAVIDDDKWMRRRRGEVPSSCARAAIFEALSRKNS